MKIIIKSFLTLYTFVLITACNKNGSPTLLHAATDSAKPTSPDTIKSKPSDTTVIFAARWNIVSDSIANINNYWNSEGEPIPGFYTGGPNDYFNFFSNGTYTGSENGSTGSGTYQLLPDSGISISDRNALGKAKILVLTRNTLKIIGSDTSSTGGILNEIIIFKR